MIKLIKSSFYKEKETRKKLANFVARAKVFSMDKECAKFEDSFSKKQDRKYSVFVSSGSSANLLLIQSLLNLGLLKKRGKVGISALTWSTNVMPLIQLGLEPIAIDCSLETLNISPEILKKHIKDIKCLFITNVLGLCDQLDEIAEICKENNVTLLEDNCESLGSKYNNKLLGNFGLASTFSFFVGHHLSTIEGGMVCTDDKKLYHMLLKVRAHGWDRNLPQERKEQLKDRHGIDDFYTKYTFYDLSYNARPNEISGFLGNSQLKYWNEIVSKREKNFNLFLKKIKNNKDIINLNAEHMDTISSFAIPLIFKSKSSYKIYKNKFEKAGVEIRPIIAGDITAQPFFKKYIKNKNTCPNARYIHENGFYFSNDPNLTKTEINTLIKLL